MNRVFISVLILFFSVGAGAQTMYNLQQCIDSALANNIPVQRTGLKTQQAQIELSQAKSNQLPNLNAGVDHGLNFGRSIDPFTNAPVTQSVNTANYGLSSNINLFNGFSLQNDIRQNKFGYQASQMEWQQAKDELVLNVILAYLSVLGNEDQVDLAVRQAESSNQALRRLQLMDSVGAVRPSDVFDLQGQLMNDQLSILNAKSLYESSKLALAQLMNKSYDPDMKLERISSEEFLTRYPLVATDVYQNSLHQFALIKAVEWRRSSAMYGVKAARGQLYPTVSLGGGFNTTYSSIAQNASGKIPYGEQLRNNRFSSVGIGLSIPIFNQSFAKNRIRLAEVILKDNELVEANTKLQLQQQIDQAYLNMNNAYDRYKVLLDQANAYDQSFKAAEIRFNAGVGTSIDYLTAKDRLDRSRINLVNAKYDFVLRKRILDYYNGKK